MISKAEFAIEVLPRYRQIHSDRWPIAVVPQPDELLSSWLHRLALANGIAPRHFASVFELGGGMWSARLDLFLPDGMSRLLHDHSGIAWETLAQMASAQNALSPLLLPLRQTSGSRRAVGWLNPHELQSRPPRRSWRGTFQWLDRRRHSQ
ncbi:TniQ family protein (plasmid) [Mesorhizobium sp. AR07]|uniref:TniQ family protein n=1 Tax=Mesorhizobium sp. AR07 TaxID=2865838 RepID=UPI00215EAF76|nr:TniQ family protein [Mesorhizobium sp. AR07]UVK48405.1 TniQ family protein [Mesorhizobium sp. AR07]